MSEDSMKIISVLIIAGLVAAGFLIFVLPAITGNIVRDGRLPPYAQSGKIREAYQFAATNPSDLEGIPCSCGCMQHLHDGRIHRRGLLDCFMREDGNFERHGSQCEMCINAVLDVKEWKEQGFSYDEIKAKIIKKYGGGFY
ncbi:MAG: PCYCGC motif-containing (lipo)protein [Candidatus Pacearchaeota archaeon]